MCLSARNRLSQSGIFAELARRRTMRIQSGLPVIDLSIGSPDLPPPEHVRRALAEAAMNPDAYGYAMTDSPQLRQAAVDWYQRRFGVSLDPSQEILSLQGSHDGLMHICLALLEPGDTVLIPDPCYPAFAAGPVMAGAKLHSMPLLVDNNYLIDFQAIPREVARSARLMFVSYPNNPTTALAPDAFYDELIAFAHDNDIIVVHDNAYSEILFDGVQGRSFLEFDGAGAVGIEFNSLSKPYGLPGARIGLCLGNKELCRRLATFKSNIDYGMFLPVQAAAVAALVGDQSCVHKAKAIYEQRRNVLCAGMQKIGWHIQPSGGTIFVWASLPEGNSDSFSFCNELFTRSGVLLTPGLAFGALGEGYVRLALVRDEATLTRAVDLIGGSGLVAVA